MTTLRAGQTTYTMTTRNEKLTTTKEQNKVKWQEVEYDADHSDVEGLYEMPCPVAPGHQNYPIDSSVNDLNFSLEYFQQLRRDGNLLPVDIVQINRSMQMFRRELNSVLEAVSSRHLPAKTAEDPGTDSTEKSASLVAAVSELKPPKGILVSGNRSRRRNTRQKTVTLCDRTSSRRAGGEKRNVEEPLRSSDSAYGSSPRNRPKSAEASVVKHRAKHKKKVKFELDNKPEIEPTHTNQELEKELERIRQIFRGMLDGTLAEEMNPQLQMMQKKISDLIQLDPDFSLMELVEEQLKYFY